MTDQPVKPRKKPGRTKRAEIVDNARMGIEIKPKKVACFKTPEDLQESGKAIAEILYEASLPRVRSNEQLYQRFTDYFNRCISAERIPTIEECFLCTGYSYTVMQAVRNGKHLMPWCTNETIEIVAWAVDVCRAYDAKMVMAGKLPQVPYIFRSKNHYGMSDTTKVEIVTTAVEEKPKSLDDIARKYGIETSFKEDEEGAEQ